MDGQPLRREGGQKKKKKKNCLIPLDYILSGESIMNLYLKDIPVGLMKEV